MIAQLSIILLGENCDTTISMNPNIGYTTYKDDLKPSFKGKAVITIAKIPEIIMIPLLRST